MTCELNRTKVLTVYAVFITTFLMFLILHRGEEDALKVSVTSLPEIVSMKLFPTPSKTTPSPSPTPPDSDARLPSTPPASSRSSCGDFVIFSDGFRDGRGLGNQIFNLAAGVLVAQLTARRIAVNNSNVRELLLEGTFDHSFERFNETCDTYWTSDKYNLAYNPELEMLEASRTTNFANKTISISGFFQSWRYTINEELLRSKYLRIKSDLKKMAKDFFDAILPAGWRHDTFTRVGIHVRRGDVLTEHSRQFGYTTPESSYFRNAMLYMMLLYKRVQFVVVSNDKTWVRSNLTPDLFKNMNTTSFTYNVTHSSFEDKYIEFTLLASCHHVIMSTGTFGWWAAWLSRGATIYYKNWPRKGSPLETKCKKEDFFPPNWIGMSD